MMNRRKEVIFLKHIKHFEEVHLNLKCLDRIGLMPFGLAYFEVWTQSSDQKVSKIKCETLARKKIK